MELRSGPGSEQWLELECTEGAVLIDDVAVVPVACGAGCEEPGDGPVRLRLVSAPTGGLIRFAVSGEIGGPWRGELFSVDGRMVGAWSGVLEKGASEVSLNANHCECNVPSGVYFLRMDVGGRAEIFRIPLVR